jgi:hypothetical protein
VLLGGLREDADVSWPGHERVESARLDD